MYVYFFYDAARLLTPATLSDLDGIDMMDLPVDLEESEMTFSPEDIKYVLVIITVYQVMQNIPLYGTIIMLLLEQI